MSINQNLSASVERNLGDAMAVDYKYTRAELVHELECVAAAAMSDGETYAPQNAWAIALYQAAAIVSGDEHCNDDEIRVCNTQYRHLEGLNLPDGCDPNPYEPLG